MATRKLKPTAVEDVTPKTDESFHAMLHRMVDQLPAEGPSFKRLGVAFIAQLATGFACGYVGGTLLGYAIAGAALLTTSAFVIALIAVLGIFVTILMSLRASRAVSDWVLDGTFERVWALSRDFVAGLFVSTKGVTP